MFKDTAGTQPVTADGDAVARINDKSGNGNHLTQATAANRPLYKTSGGLHWLEFDGTNDQLASAAFGAAIAQPLTFYAAWQIIAGISSPLADGLTSGGRVHLGADTPNGTFMYAGSAVINVATRVAGTSFVDMAKFQGASSTFRRNGSEATVSATPGANSLDGLKIGQWQGGTAWFNGKLFQFLVVAGTLSSTQKTSMDTLFGAKAGLSI